MSGDAHVGRTLGRYAIEATIGSGGFATVYRAVDTALERQVALKVLDPSAHRSPTVARRFVNEGRSVARLDHPAIVPVYDVGETDGLLWMAMRLVDGPTLDDALSQRRLARSEVAAIVDRIAGALGHAHAHGVVHRDVKPSNILLERGEPARAWLADFGIAATARTAGRYTTGTLGTAAYMAPEQARPSEVGPPADLYSLGCVVYLLVAGRAPFPGEDHVGLLMAHATQPVPSVGDESLDRVLRRALAKDPDERPASAPALADELRPVLVGSAAPDGYEGDTPTELGFTAAHEAAVADRQHQPTLTYGTPPEAVPQPAAGPPAGAPSAPAAAPPGPVPPPPPALGEPPAAGPPAAGGAGGAGEAAAEVPGPARRAARRGNRWLVVGVALILAGVTAGAVALVADRQSSSSGNRRCDRAGICFDLPERWDVSDVEPGVGRLTRSGDAVATYRHQSDEGFSDILAALDQLDACRGEPVPFDVGGTDGARCDNPVGTNPEVIVATITRGRVWIVAFQSGLPDEEVDAVLNGIEFVQPG